MSANCPKCDSSISRVNLSDMPVHSGNKRYVGVAYTCPSCRSVLSVSIDPIAIKTDIVKEVLRGLGK